MSRSRSCRQLLIDGMRVDDLQQVAGIEIQSFTTPWPLTAYRHELESNPNAFYVVARCREENEDTEEEPTTTDELVGYAGLWALADEAHISTIAVHPRWRGNHIGEALLVRLIDYALRRGLAFVTLEVRSSNEIAKHLYAKYGFVQTGIRRAYYPDNREDALIMSTPPMADEKWRRRYENRRAEVLAVAPGLADSSS